MTFISENFLQNKLNEFYDLKQRNLSIREYKEQSETLNRFIPSTKGKDKLVRFINGLNQEYHANIWGGKPDSIDEAATLAERYKEQRRGEKRRKE